MKKSKMLLRLKFIEDGKVLWYCIEIVLSVIAFLIRSDASIALALLIGGMILGAFFTSSFHVRTGVHVLLTGEGFYRRHHTPITVFAVLIGNIRLLAACVIFLCVVGKGVSLLCVIYGIVVYLFSSSIGLLVGRCAKGLVGFLLCVCVIGLNFLRLLNLEQSLRYVSPVIQVGNLHSVQWWNLLVLSITSICIILFLLHKKYIIIVIGALLISSVMAADIHLSAGKTAVSDEYFLRAKTLLTAVNQKNTECGFESFDSIEIYKSTYYPFRQSEEYYPYYPDTEKAVIYTLDGTIYMNCFTESLCNLDDEEIVLRAVISLLKPKGKAQNVMVDLYCSLLLGDDDYVNSFLHDRQIERYGEVVSKTHGITAETLLKSPERFAELYSLAAKYENYEDLAAVWEDVR